MVVVEFFRVRCPSCVVKAESVAQLPSKAPFSEDFEDAVGMACESAVASRKLVEVPTEVSEDATGPAGSRAVSAGLASPVELSRGRRSAPDFRPERLR